MTQLALQAVAALVLLGALLSLLVGGGLLSLSSRIRRDDRRAAVLMLALVLPPTLACAVVVAAVLPAVAELSGLSVALSHHEHYRFGFHGGAAALPGAVSMILALMAALTLARVIAAIVNFRRALGVGRQLASLGRPMKTETDVVVVDGPHVPLCVNVQTDDGWRIVIAKSLVDALDDDEMRAVASHERAHRAHGSNWQILVARVFSKLHLPIVGRQLAVRWRQTVEVLCDRQAAHETQQPLALASALVRAHGFLNRALARPTPLAGLASNADAQRVDRLIEMSATGVATAPRRPRSPWAFALVLAGGALLLSASIHRAVENILGWII